MTYNRQVNQMRDSKTSSKDRPVVALKLTQRSEKFDLPGCSYQCQSLRNHHTNFEEVSTAEPPDLLVHSAICLALDAPRAENQQPRGSETN